LFGLVVQNRKKVAQKTINVIKNPSQIDKIILFAFFMRFTIQV